MEKQRYYNIITKTVIEVDDSNYYTVFPNQRTMDYHIILRGDETVLMDAPDKKYPNVNVVMTTQAVFVWQTDPSNPEDIISIYEHSTDNQSHAYLLQSLPDRLDLMIQYYTQQTTTQDVVTKATLLSHIKKAKKPTRKLKGKHKDIND